MGKSMFLYAPEAKPLYTGFPEIRGGGLESVHNPYTPLNRSVVSRQRVFVVKSASGGARFLQNFNYVPHRVPIRPPPIYQVKAPQDFTRTANDDHRLRLGLPASVNGIIDRIMQKPPPLILRSTDPPEMKAVKAVLNGLVQDVVELDLKNGWHNSIIQRMQYERAKFAQSTRRYCAIRAIEKEIVPSVEHFRAEILKRRHRVETECANALGLATAWRRTRYRRPMTLKDEPQAPTEIIDPSEISLHGYGSPRREPLPNETEISQQLVVSPSPQPSPSVQEGLSELNHLSGESQRKKGARKRKPNCGQCAKEVGNRVPIVQCGECSTQFHGKCVNITDRQLKKRTPTWVCNDCRSNRAPEVALFCICKQPYDSRQFYVGCDGCQDWFHPKCVNTTQTVVESTEEPYFCPNCTLRRRKR